MQEKYFSKNPDRLLAQKMFVRVCSDSRFTIGHIEAAHLTARVLNTSPVTIVGAIGFENMERIAAGEHPACSTTPPRAND